MNVVPEEQLERQLNSFRCIRDADIEIFLRKKAIIYETRGWCSTYLLVNEEKLKRDAGLEIDGYFTLSNKVLHLSDSISNGKRKKLFKGLKKDDSYMHCILIGQLGKYLDEASSSPISAYEMLEMAFEIIYQVKERITCSCVLVECKDHAKIRRIYEDYGFRELQKSEDLVQYFKIL